MNSESVRSAIERAIDELSGATVVIDDPASGRILATRGDRAIKAWVRDNEVRMRVGLSFKGVYAGEGWTASVKELVSLERAWLDGDLLGLIVDRFDAVIASPVEIAMVDEGPARAANERWKFLQVSEGFDRAFFSSLLELAPIGDIYPTVSHGRLLLVPGYPDSRTVACELEFRDQSSMRLCGNDGTLIARGGLVEIGEALRNFANSTSDG